VFLSTLFEASGYRKNITVTPGNNDVDGAKVNVLKDITETADSWDIVSSSKSGSFALEISLNATWGFHPTLTSSVDIVLNSDTPTQASFDLDIVMSFSVNKAQYWSTQLRCDAGTMYNHQIGPQCDVGVPPQSSSTLYSGDIKAWVEANPWVSRQSTSGAYTGNPPDEWQPPRATINFPLHFRIENVPSENRMYVFNLQSTYSQSCGFAEAFQTDKGLQVYLHTDNSGESLSVQSVEIEYSYQDTPAPTTADPTTASPTLFPTTSAPTTSSPTSASPTTPWPTMTLILVPWPTAASPTLFPTTSAYTSVRVTVEEGNGERIEDGQSNKVNATLIALIAVCAVAVFVALMCCVVALLYYRIYRKYNDVQSVVTVAVAGDGGLGDVGVLGMPQQPQQPRSDVEAQEQQPPLPLRTIPQAQGEQGGQLQDSDEDEKEGRDDSEDLYVPYDNQVASVTPATIEIASGTQYM